MAKRSKPLTSPTCLYDVVEEAGITPEIVNEAVLEGERLGRDQTDKLHPRGYMPEDDT